MATHLEPVVDDDVDSGFEDDLASVQSTSLASSVLNYQYENGRRYHAYRAGQYPLPNDETEQSRMDLLHHIWRKMLGGDLLRKKPKSPQRMLDVGTGTGIWAIDAADEYPEAIITGMDLSPIQPSWVPPNCLFYVDDAESEWTYDPFDLIHGRSLCGCIADWPKFYRQCFESLKPGGYLEMQEHDAWISTINKEPPLATQSWNVSLNEASAIFGKVLNVAHSHVGWMQDAGFIEVEDETKKIPIGPWAKGQDMKELGHIHLVEMLVNFRRVSSVQVKFADSFQDAVEPYTLGLYTKILGKSLEETHAVIAAVRQEFATRKNYLYVNYHFITARKPGGFAGNG